MTEHVTYKTTGLASDMAANMTLRDWFAGQALAGYFSAPNTPHQNAACMETAEYIFAMADAMIAARKGGAA